MSRLFSDVLPEWPLDEVESGLASATETDVLAALEVEEGGSTIVCEITETKSLG